MLRSKALGLVKLSDGPAIPLGAKCIIGGFGKRRAEKPKGLTAAAELGTTSSQPPYHVLCHCVRHVAVKIAGRPNWALLFQRPSGQEVAKAWNICVFLLLRKHFVPRRGGKTIDNIQYYKDDQDEGLVVGSLPVLELAFQVPVKNIWN